MNHSTLLHDAKDLSLEAPRSPRVRIHGYVLMARMIDKGRATINGSAGEYHFDCPVDNMLFGFKGLAGAEVRQVLASGASDEEIAAWIDAHGEPRSASAIQSWSDAAEAFTYFGDPDKGAWFEGECKRLRLDPRHATLFDYLEADDRASFAK